MSFKLLVGGKIIGTLILDEDLAKSLRNTGYIVIVSKDHLPTRVFTSADIERYNTSAFYRCELILKYNEEHKREVVVINGVTLEQFELLFDDVYFVPNTMYIKSLAHTAIDEEFGGI